VLTGRLLLAITVIAHQAGVDAEMALREALTRFRHRFSAMEEQALATGRNLMDLSAQEKARLWAMTSDENESASES
jgi:tetrapyrrole methylase family protein/MazG family protein